MKTCDLCDKLNFCFLPSLENLATRVKLKEGRVKTQCKCFSTPFYPLSAYISFSSGNPQENEIIAVEIQICGKDGEFKYDCDIIKGGGEFVASSPTEFFCGGISSMNFNTWAYGSIKKFILDRTPGAPHSFMFI